MEVISFGPYLQTLTEEAENRVISSLNRTERGYSTDLVSPLIDRAEDPDEGREHLREEFFPQVLTQFEWLNQAEEAQAERIGSYSIMVPYTDRREQVHSYFESERNREYLPMVDESAYEMAKVRLSNRLRLQKLHSVTLLQAYEKMPRNTNQGAPFFSNLPEYRIQSLWLAERVQRRGWHWDVDPALLYWRGQPRGIGQLPKQRTVWGYPHYLVIIGLSIQIALLEVLKRMDTFVAWTTQERIDEVITRIMTEARQRILSIDFRSFDARLIARIIHTVFDVLREGFVSSETAKLDFMESTVLHIPLLTPEGILLGVHGMPSGDPMTNTLDGLCQLFIIEYAAIRCGLTIRDHIVQGDDGIVTFEEPWELEAITRAVAELGQEISPDKGGDSKEQVTFLQNWHSVHYDVRDTYVHIRPMMRVLNGMMSYERLNKHWSGFADTIRWWQQAEASKFHPNFQSLAEFLYRHDRYSRTLSADQVLAKLDGIEGAKVVLHQDAFPYGREDLSGLTNFRVVRELNQLRARGIVR